MTSESNSGDLDLEVVAERFAEAEQSLRQVQSQLESLAKSAETSEKSSNSLEVAARSVTDFVSKAAVRVDELQGAQAALKNLLEAAQDVIDGSRLEALSGEINETKSNLNRRIDDLATKLDEISAAVGELRSATDESAQKTAAASETITKEIRRPLLLRLLTFK